MKKILIIAYYFLPMNNGGVQRIKNFKKYLPKYGYQVDILTTDAEGITNDEEGIIRISDPGETIKNGKNKSFSFLFRLYRKTMVEAGLIDDWFYLWEENVRKKETSFNMEQYDYIMASYPPLSDLKLGFYLSEKYKVPLIVDYRDGLTFEPFESIKQRPIWYKNKINKLEKDLATNSTLQIVVNEAMGHYYNEKYKTQTVVISNGFDDEEVIDASDIELPEGINIVYTGALGLSRKVYDLDVIVKILSKFPQYNFVFVGRYQKKEKEEISQLKNVFLFEQVDRNKAVAIQGKADVLLLVSGETTSGTSGKLYEYLFAKKPILNIGGNNVASKTISVTDSGKTFLPSQINEINEYLSDVINYKIELRHTNLESYTRREQCRKLAKTLDELG